MTTRAVAGLAVSMALCIGLVVSGREAGQQVISGGGGAHNSRTGGARLARDVLAHKPTLVVLMVGTNDVSNSGG